MQQESFKYYAFISYSHKDQRIAKKLQKRLQSYHLPSALRKIHPSLPKRLNPVFMDESDLVAPGTLKDALRANLDRSNYVILICSPSSAKSPYVNDEIDYFINTLGRLDRIIPLIVDGEPHAKDPAMECFPPALLKLPREDELLGIDLRKFGAYEAFIRVIATLLKLDIDDFISRNAKERRKKAAIFTTVLAAVIFIAVMLMPPPYDEVYAENVMEHAVNAYRNAGAQYEAMHYLTDCAINTPENFTHQLNLYRGRIVFAEVKVGRNALTHLAEMLKTGKIMPWSRKPMSQNECEELLTLSEKRSEEYRNFASVLVYVMSDDYGKRYYGSEYPALLNELLEIDASIAAELYQVVCTPHIEGRYADNSTEAKRFESLFASIPKQNEHLTGEDEKQAKESLARLKGARSECLSRINSCGVFEAYAAVSGDYDVKNGNASGAVRIDHNPESHPESEDKSAARVLNDLVLYMHHEEIIYSDIVWVLDAFEKFDREKSWESLLLARAALAIAKADIMQQSIPVLEMTPDDEQRFMKRGIDVSFMSTLDMQFNAEETGLITKCNMLQQDIMSNVFMRDEWGICMRTVANERKITDCYMKYLADMADWILASINNPETTQRFTAMLEQYCPKVRALQRKAPESVEDIEASTHKLLDQIESLVMDSAKILGASTNRLNFTRNIISQDNMDVIRSNALKISGMPFVIPLPNGVKYSEIETFYFWNGENNKLMKSPDPRTKLTRPPDGCRVKIYGMSLERVKAYQQELKDYGIYSRKSWEEDNKFTIYYVIEDSKLAIIWEDGEMRILMLENPVCFVPRLYLPIVREQ